VLQHPNLYPFMIWGKLICGISFPLTCQSWSRWCHALTSICKMRCRWPFIRPSRGCGVARVDVGNVWSRLLGTIARSMALVWWTGAMAGSMAGLLQDAPRMCSVSKCVLLWLVQSSADGLPS
jgi:hypothetical protein